MMKCYPWSKKLAISFVLASVLLALVSGPAMAQTNTDPVLDPIGDYTAKANNPLTFTATATDADLPPQTLTYSLGAGAPLGASIDPTTGVFTWTPTLLQIGEHPVTVIVTDNGTPALSDEETLTLTVEIWSENWDAYTNGQQVHGVNGWEG